MDFQIGDKVSWKADRSWVGVVVGVEGNELCVSWANYGGRNPSRHPKDFHVLIEEELGIDYDVD